MAVPILLIVAGLIALGLPRVTHRDHKRFWHPWVNIGLLPMVVGTIAGHFLASEVTDALQPLLAAALVAGGLLVGTQLRLAYLLKAGQTFLRQHSVSAVGQWLLGGLVCGLTMYFIGYGWISLFGVIGCGCTLAAFNLATVQTPPGASTAYEINHREIVAGHVAPAGWWNILAMLLGGASLTIFFGKPVDQVGLAWPMGLIIVAELAYPIVLGFGLGWLAVRSRNRDEAYVFLLAMIACGAGGALFFGSSPLLNGILIGAAFINASLGRSALVERAVEELEQPIAIAVGLLAGLIAVTAVPSWQLWALFAVLMIVRIGLRGSMGPTSPRIATQMARRCMGPGATGVLLTAGLVFIEEPYNGFFLPALTAMVLQVLLAEVVARVPRKRGEA